jgi:hypothetical protein
MRATLFSMLLFVADDVLLFAPHRLPRNRQRGESERSGSHEPLLDEVKTQHDRKTHRRPSVLPLRIVRFNQRLQLLLRHSSSRTSQNLPTTPMSAVALCPSIPPTTLSAQNVGGGFRGF